MSVDYQKKINHLAVLLKALLPSTSDASAAATSLKTVLQDENIEDEDEDGDEETEHKNESLNLRRIRIAALDLDVLQYTWRNNNVKAHQYAVGDLGYIPEGDDPDNFTVLCNVLRNTGMEVQHNAWGGMFSFDHGFVNRKDGLQPFHFPNNVAGCVICVHDLSVSITE